jgi:glycosyltransferase involved in cell wall biosynthesis
MRLAIQASDLDHPRIDGTRVYLYQLLKFFGALRKQHTFFLYHKGEFNEALIPKSFPNYHIIKKRGYRAWMQTVFAWEMFRTKPEKVFLPLQAAPLFFPKQSEITATIHDLAFRFYPETFTWWTRLKLNFFLSIVLWRAQKIITVSHATKRDLIYFYPTITQKKQIKVIHHGFDKEFYGTKMPLAERQVVYDRFGLEPKKYLLYVGALQPRKNLIRVVDAFEKLQSELPDVKLVLAGEVAWLSERILEKVKYSSRQEDIVLTGGIDFETLRALYQGAALFVFPSLYEGFGLPILEAFASEVPVLLSENSCLYEVAQEGAWYCNAFDVEDIAKQILALWHDAPLQTSLVQRGNERLKAFSWEKTAEATLEFIFDDGPADRENTENQ